MVSSKETPNPSPSKDLSPKKSLGLTFQKKRWYFFSYKFARKLIYQGETIITKKVYTQFNWPQMTNIKEWHVQVHLWRLENIIN